MYSCFLSIENKVLYATQNVIDRTTFICNKYIKGLWKPDPFQRQNQLTCATDTKASTLLSNALTNADYGEKFCDDKSQSITYHLFETVTLSKPSRRQTGITTKTLAFSLESSMGKFFDRKPFDKKIERLCYFPFFHS